MSYRVFARKYRPQRFDEVVGQRSIIQTLQNAISTQKLAQAYLFVGPRGVGKTSIARIFAKALNCHEGVTINPCGHCPACLEIAEGHSMDVLEIDGASNNSVESIRTLRENAAFAPARGPYKIYLIDEVHMLTTAAFNALLKTLEEPPEHVKFIFATTEAQKLPATITSRCQRFDLRRLTEKEIADHLCYIAQKEEIILSPEAAMTLAHGADGALRDAESMFDQLVAFCGKNITEADVQHIFGLTSTEQVHQLGKAILTLDVPTALGLLQEQSIRGKDLTRLFHELIKFFRDLLVEAVHPSTEPSPFAALRVHVTAEKLLVLLEELGKAEERFRWTSDKKLQFDVLVIKAIHLLQEVSLSDVLEVLTNIREGTPPLPAAAKTLLHVPREKTPVEKVPVEKTPVENVPVRALAFQEASEAIAPASTHSKTAAPIIAPTAPIAEIPQAAASEISSAPSLVVAPVVLEACKSENETTAIAADPWSPVAKALAAESVLKFGWLTSGRFLERRNRQMMVQFPSSYEAQTETLFWSQARKKIQEALSQNLGEKIELVAHFTGEAVPEELLADEIPEPEEKNEAPKKNLASVAPKKEAAPTSQKSNAAPALTAQELEDFKNDPLIQKALEIFEAEIIAK